MSLTPDLREANHFLSVIAPDRNVTFQTFDDDKTRKEQRPHLSKILHGLTDENLSKLERLNKEGAGIFYMVNRGDMSGRKAENVKQIRAVFVDLDENGQSKLERVLSLKAKPRIVIESSPGKYHAYWLIDGELPLENFKSVQQHFIKQFGGDPSAKDLPRVLRVPGFFHRKGEPYQSRILYEFPDSPCIPVAGLNAKANEAKTTKTKNKTTCKAINKEFQWCSDKPVDIKNVRSALSAIPPDDYDTWCKIGMALKDSLGDDGLEIWREWSATSEKFNPDEINSKWESFTNDHTSPVSVGTIYHLAKEGGWSNFQEEHLTDVGNGQRLVRYFGEDLRYVPELGKWLVYKGGLWKSDSDGHINRLAKKTTDRMIQEGRQITDDEQRQRLMKHALASENSFRLKAMIDMAATEEGIVLRQGRLDRNPELVPKFRTVH